MTMLFASSIELPSRRPVGRLALFGRFSCVGEESALFAAVDAFVRPQPFENNLRRAGHNGGVVLGLHPESFQMLEQALNFLQLRQILGARRVHGHFQLAAHLEPLHHWLEAGVGKIICKDLANGRADQFPRDVFGAANLAFVLELEFSGHRGNGGIDVGHAGDDGGVAAAQRALLGAAEHVFKGAGGQALGDARAPIHALVLARLERNFLDNFADVVRHFNAFPGVAIRPRLLRCDGHSFCDRCGIMRANFGADAVLQGRDDLAARGVVFRIRGEYKQHIERHPHRIAFYLDVAFLHDVEQSHLDFSGEVRKLVDGEDSAIGAGKKAVVNRQLVRKIAAASGCLDGIHVADHIRDGDVRRSELFDVAVIAAEPGDRRGVAFRGDEIAANAAQRRIRIVVDFASLHDRNMWVHEAGEVAKNPRFRLAAQAEKNEMMARKDGVDDLGYYRVVVPVQAGKERLALFHLAHQILAQLLSHTSLRDSLFGPLTAAKLTEGFRELAAGAPFLRPNLDESNKLDAAAAKKARCRHYRRNGAGARVTKIRWRVSFRLSGYTPTGERRDLHSCLGKVWNGLLPIAGSANRLLKCSVQAHT